MLPAGVANKVEMKRWVLDPPDAFGPSNRSASFIASRIGYKNERNDGDSTRSMSSVPRYPENPDSCRDPPSLTQRSSMTSGRGMGG
jgi:hypothetical protein